MEPRSVRGEGLAARLQKMAYIQMYHGTYGIETTVAAMDQSVSGVAEVYTAVHRYHGYLDEALSHFEDILRGDETDQEKAAMILRRYADMYRLFFTQNPDLTSGQTKLVEDLVGMSGLDQDDLRIVGDQLGLAHVFTVLPSSVPYRQQALDRIDLDYNPSAHY